MTIQELIDMADRYGIPRTTQIYIQPKARDKAVRAPSLILDPENRTILSGRRPGK